MKCSKCGFENDSDALFCEKCGTSFSRIKVDNASWIRRNRSWVCVYAGLLSFLWFKFVDVCILCFFKKYGFIESLYVFFFDSECWIPLFIGILVWASKISCAKPLIAKWIIWLFFCFGTFLLSLIILFSEYLGVAWYYWWIIDGMLIILIWAYCVDRDLKKNVR